MAIEEVIAEQRLRLLQLDQVALHDLEDLYRGALDDVTRRLMAVPATALDAGRLDAIRSQVEQQLDRLARAGLIMIEDERQRALEQAAADFREIVIVLDLRGSINLQATERIAAALQPGTPLNQLLAQASLDGGQAARQALFSGVALGDNPRRIGERIRQVMETTRARAQTIARTETMRAYRGSIRERMSAAGPAITGWVWIAARDRRCCAMCWAMHGTVHRLNEPMATHPNCRCSQAPTGPGTLVRLQPGAAAFAALPAAAQQAVLGPAKYSAYKAGAIQLEDLVGQSLHPAWGAVQYERSLSAVLGDASAREFYRGAA